MLSAKAPLALGFALALLTCGCGPSLPESYVTERDAASRAYSQGRYREAAEHWQRAEGAAPNARERDEARYRRAAALERAGDLTSAEALYAELSNLVGERGERACFSRADLVFRRDARSGQNLLRAAIERYPNSGLAAGAAHQLFDSLRELDGEAAELGELNALSVRVRGSELEEALLYRGIELATERGEAQAAHDQALALARQHPYPKGKYWDDALLRAAELDLTLARPTEAAEHLQRLLSARESAWLVGSYDRSNFAVARYRLAELYRDHLRDLPRARAEFRRLYAEHPTNRLRDDALFEAALIALREADSRAACEDARLLQQREAESRFTRCARQLCAELPPASVECNSDLAERISSAGSRKQ